MKSLLVLISAILWTVGRYQILPKAQWQSRHWLIKGAAISLAIVPICLLAHWSHFISFMATTGVNAVIAAEIIMHLFLITVAIQGVIGAVFIRISWKDRKSV
ncbi:hypothetical protein [Thaumasiovibrio subtropicus]|uniref:hypothetical protein n=1 Tax=Thaumasiovibrio subtropicus TaxID=1891207 RepID=UPI000B34E87F|nr:hypothetical protein [Thaumasiovibrio subtropicus]